MKKPELIFKFWIFELWGIKRDQNEFDDALNNLKTELFKALWIDKFVKWLDKKLFK